MADYALVGKDVDVTGKGNSVVLSGLKGSSGGLITADGGFTTDNGDLTTTNGHIVAGGDLTAEGTITLGTADTGDTSILGDLGVDQDLDVDGITTLDRLDVDTTDAKMSVTGSNGIDANTTINVDNTLTLDGTNGAINQTASAQNTLTGNLNANGGVDVTGALTQATGNVDLDPAALTIDPTLDATISMDTSKKFTVNAGSNTADAILFTNGSGQNEIAINTSTGAEEVVVGNATTNTKLTQNGTGQVEFNGNVNADNGLDVTGSLTQTGGTLDLDPTTVTFDPTGDVTVDIDPTKKLEIDLAANNAAAFTITNGAAGDVFKIDTTSGNDAVQVGSGTNSTEFKVVDPGGTVSLDQGSITAAQDITATSGDIEASAGSVAAGNAITATNGDITATNGDIVATNGDISAAGNATFNTNGLGVTTVEGDLIVYGDIKPDGSYSITPDPAANETPGGNTTIYGQDGGDSTGAQPGGVGGDTTVEAGGGGAGSGVMFPGVGGDSYYKGGQGGAGTVALPSGAGGDTLIEGGSPGATGGAGFGAGGNVYLGSGETNKIFMGEPGFQVDIEVDGTGNFLMPDGGYIKVGTSVYVRSDRVSFTGAGSDPGSLVGGDLWYRSDTGNMWFYDGAAGGSALLLKQPATVATNDLFQYNGTSWDAKGAGSSDALTGPIYLGGDLHMNGSGTDILWDTDGGGNIGASGATRPDYIYAKTEVKAGNSTSLKSDRLSIPGAVGDISPSAGGDLWYNTTSQVFKYYDASGLGATRTIAHSGTSLGTDLSGTISAPTVAQIRGVGVSATGPSTGDALIYTGSTYNALAVNHELGSCTFAGSSGVSLSLSPSGYSRVVIRFWGRWTGIKGSTRYFTMQCNALSSYRWCGHGMGYDGGSWVHGVGCWGLSLPTSNYYILEFPNYGISTDQVDVQGEVVVDINPNAYSKYITIQSNAMWSNRDSANHMKSDSNFGWANSNAAVTSFTFYWNQNFYGRAVAFGIL